MCKTERERQIERERESGRARLGMIAGSSKGGQGNIDIMTTQ